MKRDEFQSLMDDEFERLCKISDAKGHEYAGDDDALRHFKETADGLGLTPEQVLAVFAGKHWSAILSYCKEGTVHSEPIEGRVRDLIMYGFLLLGLIKEGAGRKIKPLPEPEPEHPLAQAQTATRGTIDRLIGGST